jgi:electron transport complex protein RnfE
MATTSLLHDGLVARNPGFVQLLGLCPLLAVSTSVANALGLGLATLGVLLLSSAIASLAGPHLPREVRLAVFVVVIAAAVGSVEIALAAWRPELHAALGIFLPLIVTNCLVLARAESCASREPLPRALLDALAMGAGFLLALLALGAVRELLGRGSLGIGLEQVLGPGAAGLHLQLLAEDRGLLLALLPPGAFLVLGLMLAAGQAWSARRAATRRMATSAAT